jgi:hypothetical protein
MRIDGHGYERMAIERTIGCRECETKVNNKA